MGYEKKSIQKVIDDINAGRIYLPAIQRKYVWSDSQITRLFDSIMLGYPIGTFLFWKVKKTSINAKEYSMYMFIKDFHERDMYRNPPAPQPFTSGNPEDTIWSVLDGQQRLTSMYIALQGSVARKLPRKQWKNDDAFPRKQLYFNLHSQQVDDDDDISYAFRFMTATEASQNTNGELWYLVKDILKYQQAELVTDLIVPKGWTEDIIAMKNVTLLHTRLICDELINYFEVEAESIDSVLDIFVRVNAGGTVLSKSDLLFSTIVSHWDKARDEIDKLLNEINKFGEGYKFSNDFIIRTCLYVMDMSVRLKVETFKQESVLAIKSAWPQIKEAIKDSVKLFDEFGFNFENIISYVALTPVVYYRFKRGAFDAASKSEIRKYIVVAQVKQIFGASSNSALTNIRDELKKASGQSFTLQSLQGIHFTGDRSLKCNAEDIEEWFDTYEINAYTFMILSLLYPNLKYAQKGFHQDHMHPHTSFEGDKLNGLALPSGETITADTISDWKRRRNTLANLQLLEGRENESKNDMPLTDWLADAKNKENVKYLPQGISYSLNNFEEFMAKRQELMIDELKKVLL